MIRDIKLRHTSGTFKHDDTVSETTIRFGSRYFFKVKHGKRETYTFYRGCIIVRNTVEFDGCRPRRMTTVYIYSADIEGTHHLCDAGSIAGAKRMIDTVLEASDLAAIDRREVEQPEAVTVAKSTASK